MGGEIRVGCSGCYYDHWVGGFYPEGTRPGGFFEFYRERFTTVDHSRKETQGLPGERYASNYSEGDLGDIAKMVLLVWDGGNVRRLGEILRASFS